MTFYDYFQKIHTFRVHTNKHAGSFEREMCAYVTGTTGDSTKGEGLAKYVRENEPEVVETFDPYMTYLQSENGHYCRSTIVPSPIENGEDNEEDSYYSVGMFFIEKPPEEVLKLADKRAKEYARKQNAGEFEDIDRMAKWISNDIEVVSSDFVTYDLREGIEVLWQSD